ncbi:MAG: hypothetical protein UV60_C0011G0003 [Parcubacteria group bacterium GW2011_GWA2_43_11]|nr:MAG: hypothetical protein UU89_C0046G0003 [Parcubacteria group bacterium GW2011_GWC2_42_11]KKS85103.1 MAG: hypothetical protein UV60_C0011G0003 [Parcubacteria group bacterium GW2011_GWA2_43_11]
MKEAIFTYVYRSAIVVMFFSAMLILFVQNTAPFGLSVSWSDEGFGSSLVLTRPLVTATVGSSVVRSAALQSEVSVYSVHEVLRRDGMTYYQLASAFTPEVLTVPAVELGRTAIVTVPYVGVFVQMLTNVIGVMVLVGIPLLMLGINYTIVFVQKLLPTLSILEKGAKRTAITELQEQETEYEMTTVLKPYRLKRKLSLQ